MHDQPPLTNLQTRDIESVLHPYTPLHKLKQTGTLVIERGEGIYVYDTQGAAISRACRGCGAPASASATRR